MPVWGFAHVASRSARGSRRAPGSMATCRPPTTPDPADRVNEHGFIDAVAHRAALPSAYQGYRAIDADPVYSAEREDEQVLFWPLFYTSWLIDDEIADEGFYGGDTVALSSASSKTALIAAFQLAQREGVELIGLTSPGNKEWVEGLKIYGEVLGYDELGSLPARGLVYADFSGNGELRAKVHEHAGEGLVHDMAIGLTHHEDLGRTEGELPGPGPKFFFAPDRIRKRGEDWGTAETREAGRGLMAPVRRVGGRLARRAQGRGPRGPRGDLPRGPRRQGRPGGRADHLL